MTTYSISLDDVDLALLPVRAYKYNDFLKKEHFEFEVRKTEPVEKPTPTILYTCHICAIEVPAAFASEHAASVKHRANARIATVAAQRTSALISALPPPFADKPPGRFCANCATVVRKNHNKTQEHRVAVMHDKLLWQLMTAYVGEDRDNDSSTSEASDYDISDAEYFTRDERKDNKQVNKEALGINNNKVNFSHIDKTNEEGTGLNSIKTNDKKNYIKTVEKTKSDDKDNKINTITNKDANIETVKNVKVAPTKNDEVNASPNAKPTPVKEYVEFVTKYNELVKVPSDHYHSFIRRESKIECIVCNCSFSSKEANSHMFSVNHLNLMPRTIIDKDCVRKVNDVYSHCLLCNQKVKNANATKHCLTFSHGERKKQAVTGYINKTFSLPEPIGQATSSKMLIWDSLKRRMQDEIGNRNTDDKMMGHTKYTTEEKVQNAAGNDGWASLVPAFCNANNAKSTPNTSEEKAHCIAENKIVIKQDDKTMVTQSNTAERKEYLTENSEVIKRDGKTMVTPNNVAEKKSHVTENSEVIQADAKMMATASNANDDNANNIKVNNEVTNVDWPVTYPYEVTEQENAVRCVVCDCKVPNTPGNRKGHLTGSNHAKNVKTKTLLNPFEATELWPRWFVRCVICDRRVRNTPEDREEHLLENYHALNAMLWEEEDN